MPASAPPPASRTLSEFTSKLLLARYGVPMQPQQLVDSPRAAAEAAIPYGWPVVAKLCGDAIAHKTERGLVRLGLQNTDEVERAADELLASATPADGEVKVLIAPMARGSRELIAGVHRDPTFGMTVMLGIGGIFAEAVADVVFRLVPISALDAEEMIDSLAMQTLLGPFRGEPAVDRAALSAILLGLSAAAEAEPSLISADVNPLIVVDGRPIMVDALVELAA